MKLLFLALLLTACGQPNQVSRWPGRGVAEREEGPMARVFPSGGDPVEARHGLWRGLDEQHRRRWEVRYTRGNPSGPYREWDGEGRLVATWAYDWDGNLMGALRGFASDGSLREAWELDPANPPDFDPIGRAADFLEWARNH